VPTRWADNDLYGHVNNVVYYAWFDTVINRFLIDEGKLDIRADAVIAVAAESACRFRRSFAFPETIEAGLRVGRLGARSVRWEVGLFAAGEDAARADGHFVHVFVERAGGEAVAIPEKIRGALERLLV
jgi:acyl-CoA thioester hydrolase